MELNSYLTLSLRKLFAVFRRLFGKSTVASDRSTLCRFIFQSNHFSSERVKPGAFLPAPAKTRISMFFVDFLRASDIWILGDTVGNNRGKAAKARAEMRKEAIGQVQECKLRIEPDSKLHPRHVNIVGWPVDKDTQKAVAIELCAASTVHVR